MSLDICFANLAKMGISASFEEWSDILLREANYERLADEILHAHGIKKSMYTMKKDGFTTELVLVTLQKVAALMEVKATDYPDLKKAIENVISLKQVPEVSSETYIDVIHVMEKVLMLGQKTHIHDSKEVASLLAIDSLIPLMDAFIKVANKALVKCNYQDVVFYENFVYELCSQYDDIYWKYEQVLQMDIADLYIYHHDYQRGDVGYGYLFRENGIRDQIYNRLIKVYHDIDFNKAKSLAQEAKRYTSEGSPYYEYLQELLAV